MYRSSKDEKRGIKEDSSHGWSHGDRTAERSVCWFRLFQVAVQQTATHALVHGAFQDIVSATSVVVADVHVIRGDSAVSVDLVENVSVLDGAIRVCATQIVARGNPLTAG